MREKRRGGGVKKGGFDREEGDGRLDLREGKNNSNIKNYLDLDPPQSTLP